MYSHNAYGDRDKLLEMKLQQLVAGEGGEKLLTTGLSAEKKTPDLSALAVSHVFRTSNFCPRSRAPLTRSLPHGAVSSGGQRRSPKPDCRGWLVSAGQGSCWLLAEGSTIGDCPRSRTKA